MHSLFDVIRPPLVGLEPRIAQVVKLDLIGQSVAATIRELQDATRGEEARWISSSQQIC